MKSNAVKNGRTEDMSLYALTRCAETYPVRRLTAEEIPAALALMWEVFGQFEAPEYSEEGTAAFRAALNDTERNRLLNFYGCFSDGELIGVLAVRAPGHICGFFVRADYHRRGIGRKLFETVCRDYEGQEFTVNSSPYAVEIYRRLGFAPTAAEQVKNGIRYTSMLFTAAGEHGGR